MSKILIRLFLCILLFPIAATGAVLFEDDFEGNLDAWEILSAPDVQIRPSNSPGHGNVLVLIPNGDVYALIKGSDRWQGIQMEGDVLFPSKISNYLGIIYNFQKQNNRADFGNIYIKGDGSYLQVNPHWDSNVGRTLYPEYHVDLTGPAAIKIGVWQHFKVEIINNEFHFYVGDMGTPQLTFALIDMKSGLLGLQPRSVGSEVWVDNIQVQSLDSFSYSGAARPEIKYEKESLLTDWNVSGPLDRANDDLARNPDRNAIAWRSFATDERGAVLTGTVTDYYGPRSYAYFQARFEHDKEEEVTLHISSVDDLALWVNGRFHWFIQRKDNAWFDFWKNPEHAGQRIPIPARKGANTIVLRARGGVYATGGFYARIE